MKTTALEKKIASCEKIIAKLESRESGLLTRQASLYAKASLLLGYRVECGVLGPYSPMSSLPNELHIDCEDVDASIITVDRELTAERNKLTSLQAALSEAHIEVEAADAYRASMLSVIGDDLLRFKSRWVESQMAHFVAYKVRMDSLTGEKRDRMDRLSSLVSYFSGYVYCGHRALFNALFKERQLVRAFLTQTVVVCSMEAWVERCENVLETTWSRGLVSLSARLQKQGVSLSTLRVVSCTSCDSMGLELLLEDSLGLISCRAIVAAEDSDCVTTHLRYICTRRKSRA